MAVNLLYNVYMPLLFVSCRMTADHMLFRLSFDSIPSRMEIELLTPQAGLLSPEAHFFHEGNDRQFVDT